MLNRFSRTAEGRKRRLAKKRSRKLAPEMQRLLRLEPLEERRLLASDVVIGAGDAPSSYIRTPGVGNVVYSPVQDGAQIASDNINADLNAGLVVTIDTINPAGMQEGNITLNAVNLSLTNAVNTALDIQADSNVILSNSRIDAPLGSLTVLLNSDRDQATTPGGFVAIDATSMIESNGGNIVIGGGVDPATGFTLGGAATAVGVTIRGAVSSGAGDISIRGQGGGGAVAFNTPVGVDLNSRGSVSSTSGTISIEGIAGNQAADANLGISISNSTVATAQGNILIMGTADGVGVDQIGIGIGIGDGAAITSQSGNVSITGIGSASGTASSDGIVLADGANMISSQGGNVTLTGLATANASVGLRSGANGIDVIESGTADLSINADSVVIDGNAGATLLRGAGNLAIRPINPNATIGLGNGAGDLQLNVTELGFLADGFSSITIGNPLDAAGAVAIDGAAFTDPVAIVGGSITVNNGLNGDGGITLVARDAITAGQDVNITSGNVTDASGNVTIQAGDDFTIPIGATLSAPGAGATLAIFVDQGNVDPGTGSHLLIGDVLSSSAGTTITGGGEMDTIEIPRVGNGVISVGQSQIAFDSPASTIGMSEIEAVDLTNSDVALITGTVGDDTFTASAVPASTLNTITLDTGLVVTVDRSSARLAVDGGAANDTLIYDITNGLPNFIEFTGGLSASPLDQIVIQHDDANATVGTIEFEYYNETDGLITIDGASIGYVNLATITSSVMATNVILAYSGVDETLDVTQTGNNITIDSTAGEITTFIVPTDNVGIDTGRGTDTINIDGLDLTLAGTFTIADVDTNDRVIFQSNPSVISAVDLRVPNVNVDVDLTVPAALLLGPVGVGNINTRATITSGVGTRFFQPVTLTGDTVIVTDAGSTGDIRFDSTVDGPFNLMINDLSVGGTVFTNPVGQTAALSSLTVEPGGAGVFVASSIETTGDQVYNSPFVLAGTSVMTTSGGALTFNSTVDANDMSQVLTTDAIGITTFAEAVGDNLPPDALNVTSGGSLTIVANVTAENDIELTVPDGPGADQDISIASQTTVTSNRGAVIFDAGDDIDFQVGANVVANTNVEFRADVVSADAGTGSLVSIGGSFNAANVSVTGGPDIDSLVVAGPATDLTFTLALPNSGAVQRDASALGFTSIDTIDSTIDANNIVVNFSAMSEAIAVFTPALARTTAASDVSNTTLTFDNPNVNLTLDTQGGADTVTIDGLSANLAGTFLVNDSSGTPDDMVIFSNGASTIASGNLDLAAPQIRVNVDLSVDGDVSLGSASGTGEIQTSATISSSGEVVFDEPVSLMGATTAMTDADSLVAFHFSVDGNHDLNVTGGTGVDFLAENGATTPLANLTVTATAGVIRVDDFLTTADQSYNSPLITGAGGGAVELISNAGALRFGSTIDNGSATADALITNSDGVTTFAGVIGALDPLDALTVQASGTIVFATDITVINDIGISTSDSGDDNLVIQSPAAFSTGPTGSVLLDVLDNVDIQAGAMISSSNLDILVDDPRTADDVGIGSTVSINGALNVSNLTTVVGGDDADALNVSPQAGSALDIVGGDPAAVPGDTLMIDAGGVDVAIDTTTGEITVAGAQPLARTGIEAFSIQNANVLTIAGDIAADSVTVTNDPNVVGGDLLTINGGSPIAISNVTSVVINGRGGDDALVFDATNGLPTTSVTFNGQTQDGPIGDLITVIGTFTSQSLNFAAAGNDGNKGTIDLDGQVLSYTGLEPINAGDSANTILNFQTGFSNNASLRNGNGRLGTIELRDNGGTFDDTFIPNPTNSLTINLGDQGDILAIDTLDADYAASMIIRGGAGIDDVQLNAVAISNTPGRGLDVAEVETLGITNSTFSGNAANVGAGLRVVGGTTTINGSTFSGNTANGDSASQGGGGIFIDGVMTIQNGSMITGNTANGGLGSGGGILVGTGGALTVVNSTIRGNSANRAGGGIETQTSNDLTLTNVTLDGNVAGITPVSSAPGNGGGLHVTGDGRTIISGGTVSNNTAAAEGGGLWNSTGTMTVQNGAVILDNTASGPAADDGGGGIFNNGGTLNVTGSATTIQTNTADGTSGSGGGIHSVGGTVSITDALLDRNTATIDGGGLFATGVPASVTITDARIIGNMAGDSGGGAFINGPTTSVATTSFSGNQAQGNVGSDGDGGGLYVRGQAGSSDFNVNASTFDNNAALGGGGGAFFVDVDGTINGGSFALNRVTGNGTTFDTGGGGLAIIGETTVTTVSVSGVTVDENNSPSAAGIGIVDSQVAIDNSVIQNNVATSSVSGAGGIGALATVQLTGTLLSIQSTVVIDNTTAGEGGGLGIINGDLSVTDTTIAGNQATGGRGGGIGLLNNGIAGTATLRSTTISKNTASQSGGGVAVFSFGLDLENVTISANDAGTFGGGIAYNNSVSSVEERISFSTLTSNTSQSGGSNISANGEPIDVIGSIFNDGDSAAAPTVLNSLGLNLDSGDTSGFSDASDLNNADPLLGPLQDNGGAVFTHALLAGSPAIDAAGPDGPASDARGVARPIDGEANGSLLFDIGAFEAEAPFALIIDDVEVDEDVGTATITVRNAAEVAGGFTVDFATSDDTATQPLDYAVATGTLTFAGTAGESQTFTVSIFDDAIVENAETLNIRLLNPSNAKVDVGDTAVLTVNDDDTATLTVNDVVVDEDAGMATLTVTLNNAVANGFTVDFTTSDGTAVQPGDYTTAAGVLTFVGDAGESQTFTVPIIDDATVENSETINIGLANPSNAKVDVGDTAVLTVNDDDTATLTVNDVAIDEGAGMATITVTLDNPVANGFTVDFATFDGTAVQPGDYTAAAGMLTFVGDAGESQTFTVPIIDDATTEASETVNIVLANPSNATVDASDVAVITISDNEVTSLTLNDVTVDEDAGIATVTITLDNAVAGGLALDFTTTDGTAVQPGDYASETGMLTFNGSAGETRTISVSIVNDLLVEPSETLLVSLLNSSNATVNVSDTALITITDNDVATIDVADVSVDEQAGNAVVSVAVLNAAVQGGFTVDFSTVDGSATQPDDFAPTAGTLTFGSTSSNQDITIPIIADAIPEGDQQFTVVLSNVVPLGANPAPAGSINASDIGTVTITEPLIANVDLGTTIDDAPDPVLAGGELVYTVTVTNFSSSTATGVVSTTTLPDGLSAVTAFTSFGTVVVNGSIVTARIPNFVGGASETITIRSTVPGAAGMLAAATNVTSIERDTNPANNSSSEDTTFEAPKFATLNGTVTCDVFHNSPTAVNEPIAGAVVFLDADGSGQRSLGERQTTTDPSGFYQFDNFFGSAANVTVEVPSSCNTITDEPGVLRSVVAIGHIARSIASADIDLDGDLDLLVTGDANLFGHQDQSDSLTIVQNSQNGFASGNVVKLGDRPQSVYAYQPNLAEPALIAVAGIGSANNGGAVYTIQGQGSPVRHASIGGPTDVLIDDLNVDGLPDVVSASLQSILELRYGGSSKVATVSSQTDQILSIASGNLTGSAMREIVVAGYGFKPDPDLAGQSTRLELYSATESGAIIRIASVETPPEAVKVAVADIIGNDSSDGIDDNVDEIAVLFHTGKMLVYPMVNGTIGSPIETQITSGATAFDFSDRLDSSNEFVDFNRDGNIDVAIANVGDSSIELYVGAGNGQFSKYNEINDVYAPSDLVVDDFSGDGFADIAVSSFYGETDVVNPAGFISRPGMVTILQLQVASRSVSVASNATTTENFLFRSAVPQVMMDTTGDNQVTALDALRVINRMDRDLLAESEQATVQRAATDVNGDGRTSAIDALMIINYLSQDTESDGSQAMIDDLIDTDDDDEGVDVLAAIDLALTHGLV